MVLGTSKNPRAFKNIKTLSFKYYSIREGWMRSAVFEDLFRNEFVANVNI